MGVQGRNPGSITGRIERVLSFPKHADRLWHPPSLFNGYGLFIPLEKSGPDMKLTTGLHLALMLIMYGAIPPLLHTPLRCGTSLV
jgi:hypothetical protein